VKKGLLKRVVDPLIAYEVEEHSLGILDMECAHCGAQYFKRERKKGGYPTCCRNGKVRLAPLEPVPPLLQEYQLLQSNFFFSEVQLDEKVRNETDLFS
jgi:hypothetical protein